ncbi:hypothetical protein SZ54_4635 [Rhizobium sp. UR51a]|nr:hypothetical protein SZ54_4635 [Rhizobium sp. UR51a]
MKLFHLFPHGNGPVLPVHNEGSFLLLNAADTNRPGRRYSL